MAENVIIDSRTNSITVVNLIEDISSVTFPHWVQDPYIMVAFEKENGDPSESEGILTFKIDDEEIVRTSFIIDFADRPRTRTVIELNGMLVPRPGHMKVCVSVGGAQHGEWDMLVSQIRESRDNQVNEKLSASKPTSPKARPAAPLKKPGKPKAKQSAP